MRNLILAIGLSFLLSGCMNYTSFAPVESLTAGGGEQSNTTTAANTYRVKRGDTLYSIAWQTGLDYRQLAEMNNLGGNYRIYTGQVLRLRPNAIIGGSSDAEAMPDAKIIPNDNYKSSTPPQWAKVSKPVNARRFNPGVEPVSVWKWPARGTIAQGYTKGVAGNHGINITGRYGEPVLATAKGVVVYSGAGVRGYGNLVIIKHNDTYLSAYAYNKRLLVRLGEHVNAGQRIALMGRNNAGTTLLHFEIRRNGKPVDPLYYLSASKETT